MRFSDWFRKQQESGLTQSALAQQLGVTQGRIGHLLGGDLPSFKLAIRIQNLTGGKVKLADWTSSERAA